MVVFSWHLSFKFTYIAWVWEFSNEAFDWFILPELFVTLEVLLLIWPDPLRRVEIYEKLIVRFVWQFLHHLFTISFNLVANFPLNVQMSHHMSHQQPTEKCQLYFKHGVKMGDLKQSFCYLLQWMSFILQVVIDMLMSHCNLFEIHRTVTISRFGSHIPAISYHSMDTAGLNKLATLFSGIYE